MKKLISSLLVLSSHICLSQEAPNWIQETDFEYTGRVSLANYHIKLEKFLTDRKGEYETTEEYNSRIRKRYSFFNKHNKDKIIYGVTIEYQEYNADKGYFVTEVNLDYPINGIISSPFHKQSTSTSLQPIYFRFFIDRDKAKKLTTEQRKNTKINMIFDIATGEKNNPYEYGKKLFTTDFRVKYFEVLINDRVYYKTGDKTRSTSNIKIEHLYYDCEGIIDKLENQCSVNFYFKKEITSDKSTVLKNNAIIKKKGSPTVFAKYICNSDVYLSPRATVVYEIINLKTGKTIMSSWLKNKSVPSATNLLFEESGKYTIKLTCCEGQHILKQRYFTLQ